MCSDAWSYFDSSCYKAFDANVSIDWYDADYLCKSQKSVMVSLHSVEEEKFIADMVDSTEYQHFFTWLGGKRNSTNSRFEWGDGTVFDYQHFQYPYDKKSRRIVVIYVIYLENCNVCTVLHLPSRIKSASYISFFTNTY